MNFKTLKQKIFFKKSPQEVYETLMDSKKHSETTNSVAEISNEEGGEFSVWGGDIHGKNLELIPNKKIVQLWRYEGENWPKDHFSRVTFDLEESKDGTLMNFVQEGIPDKEYDGIKDGWRDFYWDPMDGILKKI